MALFGQSINSIDDPLRRKTEELIGKDVEAATPQPEDSSDDERSQSPTVYLPGKYRNTYVISLFILVLGMGASAAFLAIGVSSAKDEQQSQFERSAIDLVNKIQTAWEDYVVAASWLHGQCRSRHFDRADFRQMYEYLTSSGLDFQAAQFDPNITRDERAAAEAEARAFYAENYPHVNYTGFMGFEYDNSTKLERRSQQDYYFPIHYMEPVIGNERAIDLDYHASGSRRRTVVACMETGKPALTDRLRLVQEKEEVAYGVVLMHPGVNLTAQRDVWPRDLASLVIRIPDLLQRSAANQGESSAVFIYDTSDSSGKPVFLGGAAVVPRGDRNGADLTFFPEIELASLRENSARYREEEVRAANKNWLVCVHALDGTFEPDLLFVKLGGCIIFIASACLACWVFTNTKRVEQLNRMKAAADAEKAALILENAREATRAERELNDFIAHEVRNPVAAAMSACNFVKAALELPQPMANQESIDSAKEDVNIIDNALKFVNDLLRNMLDMHRAANKQLEVKMAPTDVLHDVLETVHAMINQRNSKVKVILDCPDQLFVMTDRLRLKQVILNLGRNSSKFVDEGFMKLRASVVNGFVELSIEDSGPGIPLEKRELLFNKFQESLDSLSQGTGIGLFLCKLLVELMGGEIRLDESYDSGVPGCPGTRFVVNLKQAPLDQKALDELHLNESKLNGETDSDDGFMAHNLPEQLSVLFVDDDPILRKLFTRTARTVAPTWTFREAANGETALRLVDDEHFDLIFMDMYMASVEKQMLGTETVKALRSRGINCRICGLSANDKETEFLEAGADTFTFKPFPCEPKALTQELCRILFFKEEKGRK